MILIPSMLIQLYSQHNSSTVYCTCMTTHGVHALSGLLTQPALEILEYWKASKSLRVGWLPITAWSSNYQELFDHELPTLERRTELQLCHLFKIVHNLCYFPKGLVTVRECSHYNTHTTHSISHTSPSICSHE